MSQLSARELAEIRAGIADLLPGTCHILTPTQTPDGQGHWTTSWGTVSGGTAVPCRLDPVSARELQAGDAVQPFHSYWLTLPYDTTISENNRVTIGTVTYEVTSVDTTKSWIGSIRAFVEIV